MWARAEHRWYPTGRFAAYNEYVKENIGQLTMKYAPGVSLVCCSVHACLLLPLSAEKGVPIDSRTP